MRLAYLFLLISLSVLGSCGPDRTPVFDFNLECDFNIPSEINTSSTFYFEVKNVPTFYSQNLANNGLTPSEVTSIVANRATITPRFVDVDLSFIRSVSIVGYPSGLPDEQREFFYMEFVDINEDETLELFSSIAELNDIVSSELIDLEIILNFRTFIPSNVESRLNFSLSVFNE